MNCRTRWMLSLTVVLSLLPILRMDGAAASRPTGTYVWIGELVSADPSAKTINIKARIPEYVARNANRFKAGDHVMLVWDMIEHVQPDAAKKGESDAGAGKNDAPTTASAVAIKTATDMLLFVESYGTMKSAKVETGYILPAEFVSSDAKTITVTIHVTDATLKAVQGTPPGTSLRVTSSMSQPTEVAALTAVDTVKGPRH